MKFNIFVLFDSLNMLEQDLSAPGASCPVFGLKRPRVRALSPSGDQDFVLKYSETSNV